MIGHDMDDPVAVLEDTFDTKKGFLGDHETVGLEEFGAENGVYNPGFILEADKEETFGCAGALPADHGSADVDALPVTTFLKIRGTPESGMKTANHPHRVGADGQAD